MRGIVLAGGTGSRLWPVTSGVSKQLLPIHDKPMIYYPISTLMLAGIREILIITTPDHCEDFKRLLMDGSQWGINISFKIQSQPKGIAEAFIIAEELIGQEPVALMLGDNFFHGEGLGKQLSKIDSSIGATIFGYRVSNPQEYGVVELDSAGSPVSIQEKPLKPRSNIAVPGIYFYDNKVVDYSKELEPSPRGELEITDINLKYLEAGNLNVKILERTTVWLDSGSIDTLEAASNYVRVVEDRQGLKIACLEEIAFNLGWIDRTALESIARKYPHNNYGRYLLSLIEG